VPERTWFYHNRTRDDRGRKRPRQESVAGPSSDAELDGSEQRGDEHADEALVEAAVGTATERGSTVLGAMLEAGANGVCVSRLVFCENVDNYVAYTFIHQHNLTREAASDLLKKRSRHVTCRATTRLNAFVRSSVNLHERHVASCRNGCVALVSRRADMDACDACGADRRVATGSTASHTLYWSLAAWLRTMLADPEVGPSMTSAMADALQAAKLPLDGVRGWYDGNIFRKAVRAGLFNSDTCVALSVSMDGFEAWRRRGF